MGFITGGFIVKDKVTISDKEILSLLGRGKISTSKHVTMEEATSRKFDGVGIARIANLILVLGSDISYSFSFEDTQPSKLDKALENLSKGSEILCFSINSIAETYSWSVFQNGKRTRVKCVAERKVIFDWGAESEYEKGLEANETGMIELIENFTRLSYVDILSERNRAEAYYG
jgi:hypothetical protein